jgi:hypothetical protein
MASKCPDANVPPEVEALINHLLAKEATDRVADAKEVIDAILAMLVQLAAAGKVDARYAPPPASGMMSNPSIARATTELMAAGTAPVPPAALAPAGTKIEGLLGGKVWLVPVAAGTVGIAVLALVIGVALRGRTTSAEGQDEAGVDLVAATDAAAPPAPSSLDTRVKEAIAMIDRGDYGSGIKRLEELATEVEGREDVHRALLAAYSATDRPKESMREAGLVLKSNPNLNLRDEVKLRVEIRDAALKEGLDPVHKAAVNDAFALLENQMGTTGWDDLYDIAYGKSGLQYPKAAARAKSDLGRGDRAKMGPTLAIAVDLNGAGQTCAVKNLLERASSVGDERALALLKPLLQPRYVGHWKKFDALACLHDGSLAKTISAIEERLRVRSRGTSR